MKFCIRNIIDVRGQFPDHREEETAVAGRQCAESQAAARRRQASCSQPMPLHLAVFAKTFLTYISWDHVFGQLLKEEGSSPERLYQLLHNSLVCQRNRMAP